MRLIERPVSAAERTPLPDTVARAGVADRGGAEWGVNRDRLKAT
jgi:hypothetical protein